MVSVEELDFDHHLSNFKKDQPVIYDPVVVSRLHRRAEYIHALAVFDAIRDLHLHAISLGHTLQSIEARTHMVQGVGRRTKFIWLSLRTLIGIILPERSDPLPHDQVETAAQCLNSIYINIRGALDNCAWCILYSVGDVAAKTSVNGAPAKVNLFSNQLWKETRLPEINGLTQQSKKWAEELKKLRDPSAHRIPLSVMPSIIDASNKSQYDRLFTEWSNASREAMRSANAGEIADSLFHEADEAYHKLQNVGKFHPLYGHDPTGEFLKIYPTVPQDIGQLVKIIRSVVSFIPKKLESRRDIVTLLQNRAAFSS
jgi:hypothetical protein